MNVVMCIIHDCIVAAAGAAGAGGGIVANIDFMRPDHIQTVTVVVYHQ